LSVRRGFPTDAISSGVNDIVICYAAPEAYSLSSARSTFPANPWMSFPALLHVKRLSAVQVREFALKSESEFHP